jgi:ADYC domain-containing protein/pentapeptide repeat protein
MSVAMLAGCAAVDAPGVEQRASTATQGTHMQGTHMQGTHMQGTHMQGTHMQGTHMQGVALSGTSFSGGLVVLPTGDPGAGWLAEGIGTCATGTAMTVTAAGASLRVCQGRDACDNNFATGVGSVSFHCPGDYSVFTSVDVVPAASSGTFPLTTPISGFGFIGATFIGVDADGAAFEIHVDDIEPDPVDASGETLLYTLSARDPDGVWQNLCEPDADGLAAAIPVAAVWDDSGARQESTDLITFGCTSGVIAKCVRWGYKPWKTVNGWALQDFHQACTRMARADYCGDGVPHTRDGTWIDMWDAVPIQTRDPNDGMLFEASWTTDGAYCVSKGRWDLDGATIALECPERLALPSLTDLLNGCVMKITHAGRSAIRTNDASYIELSLLQ